MEKELNINIEITEKNCHINKNFKTFDKAILALITEREWFNYLEKNTRLANKIRKELSNSK